jgi:DNA-binding beta-propeller fold protein YncE
MMGKRSCGRGAHAVLILLLLLGASAGVASADTPIGTRGSGKGQILNPSGLAVDQSQDALYVADSGNSRVDVFKASTGEFEFAFGGGVQDGLSPELQVCVSTCFKGISGGPAGFFNRAEGIAVDTNPLGPAVYVFENGNHRVQRFSPGGAFVWAIGGGVNQTTGEDLCTASSGDTCGAGTTGDVDRHFNEVLSGGVAVGPDGVVYVADQIGVIPNRQVRVQKFESSGTYIETLVLSIAGGSGRVSGIAVDSAGNIYVATNNTTGAVRKFSPAGVELSAVNPSFNNSAVAVDSDDRLLVADATGEAPSDPPISKILEYGADGAPLRTFYGSFEQVLRSLTPFETGPTGVETVFTAEAPASASAIESGVRLVSAPPPGAVVYPREIKATDIGNRKATLTAKVNPEGKATTYHFEYISDEDFQAAGSSFGAGVLSTPSMSLGPEDYIQHPVAAAVTDLFPETLYHFRVVAENADSEPGGSVSPTAEFTTKEPLEFGEAWSTGGVTDPVSLHAEVNPLGIPATAWFQYVELSEWEADGYLGADEVPEPPIELGEGESAQDISAVLPELLEGVTYRYRVLANNRCKPEPAPLCEYAGPEGEFTTAVAVEPGLGCPNDDLRQEGSGGFLPDCRGYEMVSPVNKGGANVETLFNISGFPAALDQAASSGESLTYSTYKAFGDVASAPYANQYLARRGDGGWETEAISPQREGPSLMTYFSAQLDRQYKAFSPDLCSGWVVQDANPTLAETAIEGYPGLYRRDNCGDAGAFEALTVLDPPAAQPPNLPPRKFIPELLGSSEDGSVTIFTVNENLTEDAPPQPQECIDETNQSAEPCLPRLYEARAGELSYVCILPGGGPYAGGCSAGTPSGGTGSGRFANVVNAISDDGSRIFWSASANGPGQLYARIDGTETIEIPASNPQFQAAAADGSKVLYSEGGSLFEYDLAAEEETLIAGGVKGVAGASEDASRVYFASTQVLTGEELNSEGNKAALGEGNLYLYEAGVGFSFIGILSPIDISEAEPSPIAKIPDRRLSRVASSGEELVFMSRASLTGYDNRDAASKERDFEVFLYDAEADELLCPSCNPTGGRPEGRQLTQKLLEGRWAAARIPTFQSQLYGQRVITDDGSRVYFDSFEALVSRDVNDEEDVYQWQELGAGECTEAAKTYSAPAAGCIDLISSGQSTRGSELVDISADGADVFIRTFESLVGQDPGLRDIYDARIGGGFAGPASPPIICEGEFCPQPAKDAPVAVAPASPAAGPGNPVWPRPKPKPHCKKGFHKKKTKAGKVRCVKNKKKRKAGQSRRASR